MKMSELRQMIKEEIQNIFEFSVKAHGKRVKEWEFPSSSGTKNYTTVKWADGVYSCNCPGWIYAKGGVRNCKHLKSIGAPPQKVSDIG